MKLYILFLAMISISQIYDVRYRGKRSDTCPASIQCCFGMIIPHCTIILFFMDGYAFCEPL